MHRAEFVVGGHNRLQTNGSREICGDGRQMDREREKVTDECPPGLSIDNDDYVGGEHAKESDTTRH